MLYLLWYTVTSHNKEEGLMEILRNSIKQHVKKQIIKKSVFLVFLAVAVAFLAYISGDKAIVTGSSNYRFLYAVGSLVLSVAVVILVAFKIGYFRLIFSREWTGTVIEAQESAFNFKNFNNNNWSRDSIRNTNAFSIKVQIDGSNKIKKLAFNMNKITSKVYCVGDRIHFIKGTKYPINLTREEEQHICPMCARNSCYGDFCPDCKLYY